MKKLLLIMMLLPIVVSGQVNDTGAIQEVRIIRCNDSTLSAAEVYSRCLRWIGKTFVSSKAVIDMQDRENGLIVAKPHFACEIPYLLSGYDVNVKFTITIEVKPGKARIVCSDFVIARVEGYHGELLVTYAKSPPTNRKHVNKQTQTEWNKCKTDIKTTVENVFTTMAKSMNEKSDW